MFSTRIFFFNLEVCNTLPKETITSKSERESSKVIYNEIICPQASVKISTKISKLNFSHLHVVMAKNYVVMAKIEN